MDNIPFKVRDRRNKGWFYLDNEYLDDYAKIFGAVGSAVYFSLCRHADAEQKCFPSEEKIAEEFGITDRTARKYLKLLEQAGIIFIDRQSRDGFGKWRCNTYWLLDKSEWKQPQEIISSRRGRKIKAKRTETDDTYGGKQFPIKDTNEKNTHWNNTNNAKQGFAGVDRKIVDLIIDGFAPVNPSNYKLYENLTQRKCVARMLTNVGIERLSEIIKILQKTNTMKYAPTITTPYELEQKWAKLEAYMGQHNISSKPSRFAGLGSKV